MLDGAGGREKEKHNIINPTGSNTPKSTSHSSHERFHFVNGANKACVLYL